MRVESSARDVSIPRYGKRGPHKHVTRFVLLVSCYHAFPCVENKVINEQYFIFHPGNRSPHKV